MTEFSPQDDANEPDLMQLAVNRNGDGTNMLSVILTADGRFAGRCGSCRRRRRMRRSA